MVISLVSWWKRSLLLLALTTTRREAATAFVHTTFLSSSSAARVRDVSTTSGVLSSISSSTNNPDPATAPLAKLIKFPNNAYSLQPTAADILPLEEGQRLVCIGDVHGDFEALKEFLSISGVYDASEGGWIGNNTILVQCGDILDRGSQELKCFKLLSQLSQKATKEGGHVILLWGNHEALNAQGLFHYTTGEEEYEKTLGPIIDEQLKSDRWRFQYSGNQPARWAAYEPGSGVLSHPILANMKVAVKVGKTVCVHAGLTAEHLNKYGGIQGMNAQAQQYSKKGM